MKSTMLSFHKLFNPSNTTTMKVQFKIEDGQLLAVFPGMVKDNGFVACYSEMGEQAWACPKYVKSLAEASRKEYEPLLAILRIKFPQYNLTVI